MKIFKRRYIFSTLKEDLLHSFNVLLKPKWIFKGGRRIIRTNHIEIKNLNFKLFKGRFFIGGTLKSLEDAIKKRV